MDSWSDTFSEDAVDPDLRNTLSRGDAVLLDVDRPSTATSMPSNQLRLNAPRRFFDDRVGHIEKVAGLRMIGHGALTTLFTRYLANLSAAMPTLTQAEAEAGMDGVLLLFATIDRSQAPSNAAPKVPHAGGLPSGGLLAQADRCIEASLAESKLDAAVLARKLGVSRSHLYRAFAPRGGVSAAIRNARLDRARQRFADPDDQHRTLAEVAYACGFTGYPTFTRAFRRRFGVSPRDTKCC